MLEWTILGALCIILEVWGKVVCIDIRLWCVGWVSKGCLALKWRSVVGGSMRVGVLGRGKIVASVFGEVCRSFLGIWGVLAVVLTVQ